MNIDDFLKWDASQPRRHELVRGSVRLDPATDGAEDHTMQCFGVCLSVQDRMAVPARWRGARLAAGRGQITCGNGNVRLVDSVITCIGGRLARKEYGLVVMCPGTRADGDFEIACWTC